ncbi:head GIN domain-containing protein [soil metagenome]
MLAAAAALLMFPSCKKNSGEGPLQSELRSVGNFSGVSIGIGGRIKYTIAPDYKVEIIAQRNILDVIQTTKENGHLLIKSKTGIIIKGNTDIEINISAPEAAYLHMSGSASMLVTGNIVQPYIDISVSGSGSILVDNVNIANKLDATVSGSGSINVTQGSAVIEDIHISGSGNIKMSSVSAERADVSISGSGNMHVKISQFLDASISGSGSVYYVGNPQVSAHISGSGKVKPL